MKRCSEQYLSMEDKTLFEIKKLNIELRDLQSKQRLRLNKLSKFTTYRLHATGCINGVTYYSVRRANETKCKYVGNESKPLIRAIMEARYLEKSLEFLDKDIELLDNFLKEFKSVSFRSVTESLPKTYRSRRSKRNKPKEQLAAEWKEKAEKFKASKGTFREEELIHTTEDGNKTRSKSEMTIYNYLLAHDYIFVYELPVESGTRTFYPDFSILSEIDYKTVIYIEHQGKMSDPKYKDDSEAREYDYWKNGMLPNRDVYFTYDDNRGGFDIGPIIDILRLRVRPMLWEEKDAKGLKRKAG